VANNSSLPIEAISVALVQEGHVSVLASATSCDTWQNDEYLYPHSKGRKLVKLLRCSFLTFRLLVDIPPVRSGMVAMPYEQLFTLKVPDNLTPHIETCYSKLRWFVRVEVHVGSALAMNLIVKVPIHIVSLGPEPLLRVNSLVFVNTSQWESDTILFNRRY